MYINSRKVSLSVVSVLSQKWAAKHGYQSARAAVCKWHAVIKAILFYPQLPPAATRSRDEHRVYRISWRDVKAHVGLFVLRLCTWWDRDDLFSFFFFYWDLLIFHFSSRKNAKNVMREIAIVRICRHAIVWNSRLSKKWKAEISNDCCPRLDRVPPNFCNKFIHGEIRWFLTFKEN